MARSRPSRHNRFSWCRQMGSLWRPPFVVSCGMLPQFMDMSLVEILFERRCAPFEDRVSTSWNSHLCSRFTVAQRFRLAVGSSTCKYNTSNAAGIRCKTCEKMATGKGWMNCYSMTTTRIGCEVKSQKNGIIHKWTTQHDTDANDNIHACVTFYYTDVK